MGAFKTMTDETLRETARHGGSSFPFAYYPENICQFDFHRIDWHWHHELEFLYVADGALLVRIGTEKIVLPEGCGMFINSGMLHRFESEHSAFIPNIVFAPTLLAPEESLIYGKYVSPVLTSSVPYQVFSPQIPWQNQILEILKEIFALQELSEKNELRTVQLLFQMWDVLYGHMELFPDAQKLQQPDHRQARLQTMMQYIHDRYREELTLDEIAASASISKSGALHIFRTYIHMPPVSYLIQYRLAQAAELLGTTQQSVSSIAAETGFSGAGYFCRKFRQRYQMSPNEYRQKKLMAQGLPSTMS